MKRAKRVILLFLAVAMLFSVTACQSAELENRYVEIPAETRNETGLTWPEGQALPSMAYPAETLDAVDIRKANANELPMWASFSGIINRTQAQTVLPEFRSLRFGA